MVHGDDLQVTSRADSAVHLRYVAGFEPVLLKDESGRCVSECADDLQLD